MHWKILYKTLMARHESTSPWMSNEKVVRPTITAWETIPLQMECQWVYAQLYPVDLLTTFVQAEVEHSNRTKQRQLHPHTTNSVQIWFIYICDSIQNLRKAASTDRVDHQTLKGEPVVSQNVQMEQNKLEKKWRSFIISYSAYKSQEIGK